MDNSKSERFVEIRVFGSLRKHMDNQNLPYHIEKPMPSETLSPMDIARELNLPLDEIEAVFVNGKVCHSETEISPGDRVGFFPYGTPGPYRVFLGMVHRDN